MRSLSPLLMVVATTAHAVDLDIDMDCWSPAASTVGICGAGSPDVRVGDDVTFNATLSSCSFFCDDLGPAPWRVQFRSESGGPIRDTQMVSQTGPVSFTWSYSATGGYRPEVRACPTSGGPCTDWDAYDVAFVGYDLDVGPNQAPEAEMLVWDPNDFSGVCSGAGGEDGYYNTEFTFTAEVSDPEGDALTVHWDFDGDGTADDTTTVGGNTQNTRTVTNTHTYGGAVSVEPAVRVEDALGAFSDWDRYDCGFTNIDLDVPANLSPTLDMQPFQPNQQIAFCPGDGGEDGQFNTEFTFTADVSDPEGEQMAVEWDYDDDGVVDARTPASGFRNGSTFTSRFTYGVGGVFEPKARALDAAGAVGDWDKYSCGGFDINLDVAPNTVPEVEMLVWDPADSNGICDGGGSADGFFDTEFTFTTVVRDEEGHGLTVEWDFDNDGTVDATDAVTGDTTVEQTITHTWTFGMALSVEPAVRVEDELGAVTDWERYDCAFSDINLDVLGNGGPELEMLAFEPNQQVLFCPGDGTQDGATSDVFTFTAVVSDDGGQQVAVEWDFDDDDQVDLRTPATGFADAGTFDATFSYPAATSVEPKARGIDELGAEGAWDKYDCGGFDIDLDVIDAGPPVPPLVFLPWEPNDADGACEGGGDRDGRPSTSFLLTVEVDDPQDDQIAVEWDFDGDGDPDLRTPATGFRPEGSIDERWIPGEELSAIPAARVLDTTGAASSWVSHTCNGQSVRLDAVITPPEGEMLCWEPSGDNCTTAPDGQASTEFTFSARYSDGDEDLGGRVDLVEWDFDGDGVVDDSQTVPPGPGTASITWTYNAVGFWVPAVRFTDNDGAVSDWEDLDGHAIETWSDGGIDTDDPPVGTPPVVGDTADTASETGGFKDGEGCDCGTGGGPGWLALVTLLLVRRRRG